MAHRVGLPPLGVQLFPVTLREDKGSTPSRLITLSNKLAGPISMRPPQLGQAGGISAPATRTVDCLDNQAPFPYQTHPATHREHPASPAYTLRLRE